VQDLVQHNWGPDSPKAEPNSIRRPGDDSRGCAWRERTDAGFVFDNQTLDVPRRELQRGGVLVRMKTQVFDLLVYLIKNRTRVVSKDDLTANVWNGRIVSDSTLTSRIYAARSGIGDSGQRQHLIRTSAKKGFRFVGEVDELKDMASNQAATSEADGRLFHVATDLIREGGQQGRMDRGGRGGSSPQDSSNDEYLAQQTICKRAHSGLELDRAADVTGGVCGRQGADADSVRYAFAGTIARHRPASGRGTASCSALFGSRCADHGSSRSEPVHP
jgi:DNA-binding winged helix-turn-helix (wHTH) protein